MGDEVEDWFPGVVVVTAVIIQRQVHNGRTKRDGGSRNGFLQMKWIGNYPLVPFYGPITWLSSKDLSSSLSPCQKGFMPRIRGFDFYPSSVKMMMLCLCRGKKYLPENRLGTTWTVVEDCPLRRILRRRLVLAVMFVRKTSRGAPVMRLKRKF